MLDAQSQQQPIPGPSTNGCMEERKKMPYSVSSAYENKQTTRKLLLVVVYIYKVL